MQQKMPSPFSSTSLRSSLRLFLEQIFHTSPKHTRLHCAWPLLYWHGSKSEIKFFRNLESAKTMNMFLSYIYLNIIVLPLVFFQYNIFRDGDILQYENLMAQMAVIFICWERRHYNKSTLSFLSDMDYQKVFLPRYWTKKLQFLSLITEKKVEIFHSKSLSEIAKVIALSGFLSVFKEGFIPLYQRGTSENNLWLLTGKTAEFLLNLFKKISNNSGKAHKVCLCSKSKLIKGIS